MLQLLRLLVHRVTGWLGSNQLLLLLLGSNWNLLQRRTMMVHARAGPNHGRTLGSDRLATVVTSTRPSLPVHNSPIRICCSRKSNRLFLSFATQEIIENTKKKKKKKKGKRKLYLSAVNWDLCVPVLMWMHHRMAVNPTPMTNEARAMPTVTSVETPTRITCCVPATPLFWPDVTSEPGDVVTSPDAPISNFY